MTITFGSLFAGIGGFDLGYHQTGMRCAWQVEIDPAARSVLAYHWPDVPRIADVRDCGAHNLTPVDVMSFGFPCQDLSVAGNRAGLAGKRSGLFYEATRIAHELRPMLLTWENVPGLLSSNSGRDFAAVLMELERIGYVGGWTTLDAQWFGVAQRRQRIFGVFARADIGATVCAEILSLATRMPGHSEKGREARSGVARGITASAGHHGRSSPCGDGSDNLIAFTSNGHGEDAAMVAPSQRVNRTLAIYGGNKTAGERSGNAALTSHGSGRYDFESENFVAATLNSGGNNGGFRTEPGEHLVIGAPVPLLEVGKRTNGDGYRDGDGIGKAGDPMYTLQSGAQHGVMAIQTANSNMRGPIHKEDLAWTVEPHPSQSRHAVSGSFGVRRLTPIECERLQGFPDGWTAIGADGPQSDSARYRQLGNAVAVPVARWLGTRIMESFV